MTKKPKEIIVSKGTHLTIKKRADGKEVLIWDWAKLTKEVNKAIKDFEKTNKKGK